MLSDAIHFGIEEFKVSLLPSQRLGINGAALKSAMDSHMRAFALDQIGAAPGRFKRQWETDTLTAQGGALRTELDSATAAESRRNP